jgi:hypothetical protein
VESFVDSQLFRGTCYKAQGWHLLGQTKGYERSRQDYYTEYERPKQLWVREIHPEARRLLSAARLPVAALQSILLRWEDEMLGDRTREADGLVAIDGKAQRGSTPHVCDEQKAQLVSALSLPSGRVLGTVAVEHKSNEIPAARQLLARIGPLDGKLVMLDALHTNQATLRQIHQDNGADYLLPVKGNHETLELLAAACLPPPLTATGTVSPDANPPQAGTSPLRAAPAVSTASAPVRYRRGYGQKQPFPRLSFVNQQSPIDIRQFFSRRPNGAIPLEPITNLK